MLTEFIKVVIGRLRPNFLDICQPDRLISDLCSPNNFSNHTHLIPEVDFKCLNSDKSQVQESRKSFPSGHASISFYSIVFLILFIHHSWQSKRMGLLPRFIQFFLFMLALYATITRSVDNKHHVGDIIAGICLGTLTSYLNFFFFNKLFIKIASKKCFESNHNDDESKNKDNPINSEVNGNSKRIILENKENIRNLNEIESMLPLIRNLENENMFLCNETKSSSNDCINVNVGNENHANVDNPRIRIMRMRILLG